MNVHIIVLRTGEQAKAIIKQGKANGMPSVQDEWKFDFNKQLKNLKHATGYILVKEDTPDIVEGCLIFELIDNVQPFMSYIEVAPHNKGKGKKHDHVAGCLIAYAFKLSLMKGVGVHNGTLHFKIGEKNIEDETKLMILYSNKYNAYRLGDTNVMVIYDAEGNKLIEHYLT